MRLPVHTLALSAAIAALFATQLALASEALDVKASGSMSGEKSYSTIHVASGVTLKVSALAGESGGLLRLRANSIVVDSGATIDATGAGYAGIDQGAGLGPGGGQPGAAGLPGGGGGGLVVVDALAMGLVPDVSAGKSGDCTMITGHVGDAPPSAGPSGCLDVDGDMHTASLCGGDDCDDADANVRPGATEVCDGVDNDCSGAADDMLPNDACSAGLECREGACVVPLDAGSAGNGAGEKPMELTFGGGCSTSKGSSTRGDAVLLAGILALTKLRRRARRQRP